MSVILDSDRTKVKLPTAVLWIQSLEVVLFSVDYIPISVESFKML